MNHSKNLTRNSKIVIFLTLFAIIFWGCEQEQILEDAPYHVPGEEEEPRPPDDENQLYPGDQEPEPSALNNEPDRSGKIENGMRVIAVKARQFEFDPGEIVVGQGEEVRLEVTSEDVMHGIMIADLGVEENLPPNEKVSIEFTVEEPGRYPFQCSVYCGPGHENMHGELVVLAAEE